MSRVESEKPGGARLEGHEPFLSGAGPRPSAAVSLPEGATILDQFVIGREVGRGAGSAVFQAVDQVRSETVALKASRLDASDSGEALAAMRRELGAYDRIGDFGNVLHVHDAHVARIGGASLLLLSMEYAAEGSFREWLIQHATNQPGRLAEAPRWLQGIANGLLAIHESGAAHLDLKPENILISGGRPKVSDLGAAHLSRNAADGSAAGRDAVFLPSLRTAAYMAPECFASSYCDEVDARADLYSFGVLAYELLSRPCRPPFQGDYDRLRELHVHVSAAPLPQEIGALATVVARCLEKDPSRRFQSARELIEALDAVESQGDEMEASRLGETAETVECLLAEARDLASHRLFVEAKGRCLEIIRLEPEHAEAQRLLDDLQRRFDQTAELYHRIELEANRADLEETVELLKEAADQFPDHPAGEAIQVAVLGRARRYREAMASAVECLRKKNWELAHSHLERALEMNPRSVEASRAAETLSQALQKRNATRERIDRLAEAGQMAEAFRLARQLDFYVDEINGLWDLDSPPGTPQLEQ